MFNPFLKFVAGNGQGLIWEIRKNGKVIDRSHPAKPAEPAQPADAEVSNARQYNIGRSQTGRDAQREAVQAIQRGIEKVRARRSPETATTESDNPLDAALKRAHERRGV
jgi:hypothetical protein